MSASCIELACIHSFLHRGTETGSGILTDSQGQWSHHHLSSPIQLEEREEIERDDSELILSYSPATALRFFP